MRAACRDPDLDVPSPTFLLCLSYKEDLGHDPEARQQEQAVAVAATGGANALVSEQAAGASGAEAGRSAGAEDDSAGLGAATAGAKASVPEPVAASTTSTSATALTSPTVHHMDPYRLGAKMDKMSGLIDWESAFRQDVCLIEWPDRMPPGGGVRRERRREEGGRRRRRRWEGEEAGCLRRS